MTEKFEKLDVILATDCGSTTTKAILIEKKGDTYRQTYRGEAPTTVEAPFEDVTKGVLNSIQEIEDLSNRKFLDGGKIIMPADGDVGVDAYISTSSAGGGLQMMVAGAVHQMTGESAQRAALGAGAIVMDILACNDKRLPHEKIERIRQLRPDMILLSGGTDGGTISHVMELAEVIGAADPKPRLGISYQLPVIFAGNKDAREQVIAELGQKTALTITDNIRPVLERENLMPARHKIQDLFLEHVMAQAPGYKKLMEWTSAPIMPTPGAVGLIISTISEKLGFNVVGVDIGGATTDIFSSFESVFNRTVSANLGMSYSVSNVLTEATLPNVMRWVPFDIDEQDLRNRIKNKMIRPTTIPQELSELMIEHGLSREALRLAFESHKLLAVGLKGVQQERSISDAFDQSATGASLIQMKSLDMLVGSGGVLSHAPRRQQAMLMMIDAFQPECITFCTVDSIFMMPHLGVLTTISDKAATEVFEKDCIIYLGTCVAPIGNTKDGDKVMDYKITMPDGNIISESANYGDLKLIKLGLDDDKLPIEVPIEIQPSKNYDAGEGNGKTVKKKVRGGVVGIVIDARGRPLKTNPDRKKRIEQILRWTSALDCYPQKGGGR
ncbi:glutamate mutase L [bacterium]|nr:glutamate mutase L [bacterium]MBU1024789.1 glutamate mutase L [bacterium]